MAKVFISATSDDLASARLVAKAGLETINLQTVDQTTFETDYGLMIERLRRKLEGCEAIVHIAGHRYGAEPDLQNITVFSFVLYKVNRLV